jgi:hypothetical protein
VIWDVNWGAKASPIPDMDFRRGPHKRWMGGSIPTKTDLFRKDVKGGRYWFSNITEAYDFDLSSLYTNLKARVRTDSRSIEHQASAEPLSRPLELC